MSARTEPYRNQAMPRHRAYDIAIAFALDTGLPCQPRPNGEGFDAIVPMEVIEGWAISSGHLAPLPPPPAPRPTTEWIDPE